MVMVCLLDVRGDVCCEWAILCVSLYFVLVCQSVKERRCVGVKKRGCGSRRYTITITNHNDTHTHTHILILEQTIMTECERERMWVCVCVSF